MASLGRRDGPRRRQPARHRDDGAHHQGRRPKILRDCTLPLIGVACVHTIVSDLAVINVTDDGLVLRERAPGMSAEEVANATGAPLTGNGSVPELKA